MSGPGTHGSRAPAGCRTIRDDRDGRLSNALTTQIRGARTLLAAAELVADHEQYRTWHERRRSWRETSARVLSDKFEAEAATEFVYATGHTTVKARWPESLQAEVRGIVNGVELLGALHSSLVGRGGPSGRDRADPDEPRRKSESRGWSG